MPMSRLPRPKYKWGQNLTPKNREFAKEMASERAKTASEGVREQTSILKNDDPWPIYKYKNGSRRTGKINTIFIVANGCFLYETHSHINFRYANEKTWSTTALASGWYSSPDNLVPSTQLSRRQIHS